MNKDGRGWELSGGGFSLHRCEGPSAITDCPSLVFSHTRRDSCRKFRQGEPEILGLGSHWRSATNTAAQRATKVALDSIPWAGETRQAADTTTRPSGFVEAISNLPSDKVLGRKTEEVSFCSWPHNFWSLRSWEDPLEKEMATCSSILAWKIPGTEQSGGLQSMGLQRVRHNWVDTHT